MSFFFSSRRRHTRCSRDWSSDVCSSDLKILAIPGVKAVTHNHWFGGVYQDERNFFPQFVIDPEYQRQVMTELVVPDDQRSEEHTSELQSRLHLVCRLLLEKKKKLYNMHLLRGKSAVEKGTDIRDQLHSPSPNHTRSQRPGPDAPAADIAHALLDTHSAPST